MGSTFKEHPIGENEKGLFPQFRLPLLFKQVCPKQFFQKRRSVPFALASVTAGPLYPLAIFVLKPVIPERFRYPGAAGKGDIYQP
jgi:hypothetical protein